MTCAESTGADKRVGRNLLAPTNATGAKEFVPASNIFSGLCRRRRFGSHGEKCPHEQNPSAPELGCPKTFTKNPGGQSKRAKRTKKLQCLREGDADFLNRDVVENVRHGDAGDGGNDKDEIHVSAHMKRGIDLSEQTSERKSSAEVMTLMIPKLRIEPS